MNVHRGNALQNQFRGVLAHTIDRLLGFVDMHVLKPSKLEDEYLIMRHGETEDAFKF